MSKVFLIDTNLRPLDPIYPAQARQLLREGKAAIFRRFPFTLVLKESRTNSLVSPLRLKIDPGAKLTGIALVNEATGEVVFAAELKHGSRQSCRTDKYGFPSRYVPHFKFVKGFKTGDTIKGVVTNGKKMGIYVGRVAVRSTGSFNISTSIGLIQGISHKYCKPIHKKDGYSYAT